MRLVVRGTLSLTIVLLGAAALGAGACGSRTALLGGDVAGSTASGDDASTTDAADAAVVPCVPGRFALDLAKPELMFVIDRSGSMAFTLDGTQPVGGQQSRWQTLRAALAATIVPFDDELAMGAKFFPDATTGRGGAAGCVVLDAVGIPPARGNANAILNVFDSTKPIGGTPTAEAVRIAASYLASSRGVARTMVLATDGAPNCDANLDANTCACTATPPATCAGSTFGAYNCLDDARTVQVIHDTFTNDDIPVYVVGIGGEENPDYPRTLDAMAVAGGRPQAKEPRYYDARTAAGLTSALTTIRDSVARCTFLTPSAPTDPDAITVEVDGAPVARDQTHASGWDWIDKPYGELEFFGDSCAAAASGKTQVVAVVSCRSADGG